jgi:DNA polymerase-1
MILAPITGVTKMILFDSDKVKEKYGLVPEQIVDYKALVGDPSDNYPGVAGIGPKGAANLLNEYKTLEGVYKNLDKINPKTAEKLATDAEQSALAKKLATIEVNSPIKLKMNECKLADINRKELLKAFEELSFNSLINRFKLDQEPKIAKKTKKEKDVEEKKNQLGLL